MSQMLYTVPQVIQMLSIGRTRVYDLIRTGELPSVRIGASRRVSASALEEFVSALPLDAA